MKAIRGVSLKVHQGSIVTVLGANGAGKSTILKTISGIIDPQKGSVVHRGEQIQKQDPALIVRKGIAHVPEGREIFPLLTVRENLLMGAYTRPMGERAAVEKEIEQIYAYFPILKERMGQPAGQLSGGQQQMLAISRALLAKPTIMLLDEPSLGLSPKLTKEIFEIVVRINRERGVTLLVVEQNARVALKYADFGYVLEVGRIVMEGTAATSCARRRTSRSSTSASRKPASAARGAGRRRKTGDRADQGHVVEERQLAVLVNPGSRRAGRHDPAHVHERGRTARRTRHLQAEVLRAVADADLART
ncbi:MAG: ABC transporter ATP-binding protein [Rhodocyclaceae bacterium]|nr:ABC transporter ATP-binding protein [Rhodocyclaceae bacterium]